MSSVVTEVYTKVAEEEIQKMITEKNMKREQAILHLYGLYLAQRDHADAQMRVIYQIMEKETRHGN